MTTALAYSQPLRTPIPKRRGTTRAEQGRVKILPTPELMAHKASLLGGRITGKGKPLGFDVNGSTEPLDVYLARDVIEQRHHQAGQRYAQDRFALFGYCAPRSAGTWREFIADNDSDADGWTLDPDERQALEAERLARLRDATKLLGSGQVCRVVRLVVLDGAFVPCAEHYLLRIGLDALADAWRIRNGENQ